MVAKRSNDTLGGRFAAPRSPEGLESEAGRLPWLGLPLEDRQERAFILAGIRLADWETDPRTDKAWVLVREDCAITGEAVHALLEEGRRLGEDIAWRSAGRVGGLAEEIFMGPEEPILVYLMPGSPITPDRISKARFVEMDPKERLIQMEVPPSQFGADYLEVPLADRLVLPAGHWLQLLWVNLLGLAPFLWRELAGRYVHIVVFRLFWAVLRARSLDPSRVAAKLGRKGKNCNIHPTAVVEFCWLGDGVEIGANAVVRYSVLADGAKVEPLAMVEASVLARGARVQRQALVKFSVLSERSAVAGTLQLGVMGVEATVKHSAVLFDQSFGERGVRVKIGDRIASAPLGMAGCCVGDRTIVGARVSVAPGRAIPPDLRIAPDPAQVLSRLSPDASGISTVRDGSLEPV